MARSSVSLHFSNSPYYPFPVTTLPTRRSTFNEPEVTTSDSIVSTKPCFPLTILSPTQSMYAGRINFRFDSSPRLSLIPRRVENNKFPPFSCFGNNNSQEENSAREKISTYICKYFATMLHDSLELTYRGKNSSPFFIKSRSQVKKKKKKFHRCTRFRNISLR